MISADIDRLLESAGELVWLVEAYIPANAASIANQKYEKGYWRIMASYFNNLDQAFPYDSLGDIYNKFAVVESLRESGPIDEMVGLLDPLLKMFRGRLLTDITAQHVAIYLAGSAQMITWGKTRGGKPIAYEGPPMRQAIDYAREHCARLVTRMDEESKNLIAQVISDGIKNKRGVEGMARDIRKQFEDMSRYRSRMIARTESCDALEQAFIDRSKDMGVTGKEWVTSDPCDICAENEAEGIVPIDHVFSGGVDRPPQHPKCRCALAPVMLEAE